jgi:diphthamide synthase (EF-2-diphthine--ammonia ligase)
VWLLPTDKLAEEMIEAGVEAYLTTVNLEKLPASFAGRRFDRDLLRELPPGVDPCGENGELHSFVAAGPMLSKRIFVRAGETVERDGFAYADLLPA